MRRSRAFHIALPALAFALLACSLFTTQVPISPTGTPAVPGAAVAYNNVSLVIPEAVGSGATTGVMTDVEYPYINGGGGPMPEHEVLQIYGYRLGGTVERPRVMVFPAEAYAAYSESNAQDIADLKSLQSNPGATIPSGLVNNIFSAQVLTISFRNGGGLRYLTQVLQGPIPINNEDLFYYFLGLTADGKYYVTAILPVSADFLPASAEPNGPTPPDGIPFDWNSFEPKTAYMDAVQAKLNAAPPESFHPLLLDLDTLIQSISISP